MIEIFLLKEEWDFPIIRCGKIREEEESVGGEEREREWFWILFKRRTLGGSKATTERASVEWLLENSKEQNGEWAEREQILCPCHRTCMFLQMASEQTLKVPKKNQPSSSAGFPMPLTGPIKKEILGSFQPLTSSALTLEWVSKGARWGWQRAGSCCFPWLPAFRSPKN